MKDESERYRLSGGFDVEMEELIRLKAKELYPEGETASLSYVSHNIIHNEASKKRYINKKQFRKQITGDPES